MCSMQGKPWRRYPVKSRKTSSDGVLRGLELRVFQRKPLDAGVAEVDLHARVRPAAFRVNDHAEPELRVLDALADAPCGCRRRRLRRASDAAPFGIVDVDGTATVRRQPL